MNTSRPPEGAAVAATGPARPGAPGAPAQGAWQGPTLSRREVMTTLGGVMLGMFLAALDQTIVGTAMPRIIGDLGGFDRYTWVTTSYIVASTAVVLLIGRLSDIYGRKWLYIACLVIFLVGSALSGASQSMNQLIAFRALQGVGAGGMMGLSFATMGDLFPPAERGKYQGAIAGMFGISSVIGPSLGGSITDNLSWHWVFFVNLPLGVPVILLFLRFFPKPAQRAGASRVDYPGAAAMVLAVVSILLGLSWGGVQYEWGSPQVIVALAFGAAMAAAFVAIELRTPEPILPLHLFKDRIVAVSLIVAFLTGFAMFGAIIFMPLFFQAVLGFSATSSGGFTTPMSLGIVAGATLSGQALSRLGGHYRTQGLIGLAVMAAGLTGLTRLSADTSFGYAIGFAVVLGFGLGTTFPTFTIAVQNTVPFKHLGVATSATQFFRSVGGSLGLALLGAFMVSRFAAGLDTALPQAAREALPLQQVEALSSNPNALLNPAGVEALRSGLGKLGDQAGPVYEQTVSALKSSLASSIGDVFTVALAVIAASFVATLLLKEVPLQRRGAPGRPAPGQEAGQTAGAAH